MPNSTRHSYSSAGAAIIFSLSLSLSFSTRPPPPLLLLLRRSFVGFFFVWVLLRRRMPAASHRVFLHRRRCSTSCFVAASNWPPPLLMWSLLALNQGHSMAFLCFVLFLFFFVVFFSVSSDTDPHFLFDSFARFCFRFCFCFGRRRLSNGSTISSGRVGYRDINFIGWWWWCCCSPGEWRGRERRSSSSSTIGWLAFDETFQHEAPPANQFVSRERERTRPTHTHTHTHPTTTTTTTTTKSYRFGRPRRPDMLNTHRLGVGPRFFFFILFFVVVVEIVLISPSLEKRRVRFYRSRSTWSAFLFARARVCVCVSWGWLRFTDVLTGDLPPAVTDDDV